ncbi:MAG: hypothetical protein ACRDHJ_02135 [Actinomycetota bacterium]
MIEEERHRPTELRSSEVPLEEVTAIVMVRAVDLPAEDAEEETNGFRIALVHLDGEERRTLVSSEGSLADHESHRVSESEPIGWPRALGR